MKQILLAIFLLVICRSLYTSSHWTKRGVDVKDTILNNPYEDQADPVIRTTCNDVNLNIPPYNYQSVVMSGYLAVNKSNSGLGFIFYGKEGASRSQLLNYPVIIWLNGGPGSSSQLGNFMELGPFFIKPATMRPFEAVYNKWTWVKNYNVLFVDQPVGTGLSYADPKHPGGAFVKSMEEVGTDFYFALKELYTSSNGCFNKLQIKGNHPLFIFGESYAGKYAPAIAERIKREQEKYNGFLTGLKGMGIGDGFTHPYDILTQVGEFAYNLGMIDYQERSMIEQIILNATHQVRNRQWTELHDSFDLALDLIVELAGNVNVYDITKFYDYHTDFIGSYLQNPDIIQLFRLNPDVKFGSQAGNVYESLYQDFMMQYVHLVETLLAKGVNTIIYNGQNDLIVETPGTFKWVERLNYADAAQFRDTLLTPWKVNQKVAGYTKTVGRLELRTVNNAGHLVPMDQGEAALEMVNSFVQRSNV